MSVKIQSPEYLDTEAPFNSNHYRYFVGIDPSYSSTGLVVLQGDSDEPIVARTIKAGNPHEAFFIRVSKLVMALRETLEKYDTDAVNIIMEGAAFASEFGAFKLGKLSGVIEYFLGTNGYNYHLTAPTYVKKVATGNGAANKQLVMSGVRAKWGFESLSSDLCDAYAMAQIARGARFTPKEKTKKTSIRRKK